MENSIGISLVVASTVSIAACGSHAEEEVRQRIERVENGMMPAILVTGEDLSPVTIWDIMQRFNVPGVSVAVINDGALEWAKGYGVLEVGGADVNTETLFMAGHISHAVAAVGALSLVEGGHISLDENINGRLHSWQVPDNEFTVSEKATLRRLLTHTSGLSVSSLLGYLPGEPVPSPIQILDGVAPAKNDSIRITVVPGSRQQYSLGGYVVLQRMLEDVTSLSYSDFVNSTVLSPLGMDRSFLSQPLPEELATNAAAGYEATNEQVRGRWRIYPELAAMGMWTTPSDVAKLVVELQRAHAGESSRVLSQTMANEMLIQQFENRGLGVEIGGGGDWRYFRLEGHGNNYLSELFCYVSQGMGAVVLTNSSNGEAVKAHILRGIATEYGWPELLPEEVEAVSLPLETLRELEGTYSFRGRDRVLRLENGRLLQSSEGNPDQEFRCLSDSTLISTTFGYRYDIDRDEAGSIIGLTLVLNGTRLFTYQRN
jgi:CubicO group peptidase (beta-lactamase class C family)